jgi:hypothetical protein
LAATPFHGPVWPIAAWQSGVSACCASCGPMACRRPGAWGRRTGIQPTPARSSPIGRT